MYDWLSKRASFLLLFFHEISFIPSYTTFCHQLLEFIRKRLYFVMFFLPLYVVYNRIFVFVRVGECCVFFSPMIKVGEMWVAFEPSTRERFYVLDKSGYTHCCGKTYKHVYVVGHTSYTIDLDIPVVGNTQHIGIKFTLVCFRDGSFAAVGSKDNMI